MLATLTGLGLSAAAGLNAYIPFLIVALVARFTDIIDLPQSYAWIESPWAIGVAAVLLLAEIVSDKVPAVDSLNDAVGTFVRPLSGGLIFAATSAAADFEKNSQFMAANPWIGVVLGVLVALLTHGGKAASRPVLNAGTGGLAAPVVSAGEDGFSFTLSLVAIFMPILVILFLLILFGGLIIVITKFRQLRKRRALKKQAKTMTQPGEPIEENPQKPR
ncbi:MAG: DUF4126 domain-containing protein [Varibaculum sp.]|nr:DUF4126 domain-containing protein [Varibaculum sp.]